MINVNENYEKTHDDIIELRIVQNSYFEWIFSKKKDGMSLRWDQGI